MDDANSGGGFFQSCLPRTHAHFVSHRKQTTQNGDAMDEFDRYVKENLPFLGWMVDQYYVAEKNPGLQLRRICEDERLLEGLDVSVLGFIRDPRNAEAFQRALAGYVFILESAVVRLAKKADESRHD